MTTLECESPKHEKMQKSLSTQLAVAIRSIQWSYGIFWASSTTQEGILEWRDGYYNGDIKTRKTVQTMIESNADQIRLQRSEQLKELYKFILIGESDSQTKRPYASLSPEDLSDSEWYYLVCMSYVFNSKQSLPGKALESGETIWLCNAQHADNNVFSRSLLAKSASIQTVVCFPYLGGVIEIGTTELLQDDPNLIQHVKACFLEISKPICSDKCSSDLNKPEGDDKYPTYTNGDKGILDIVALENSGSFSEETKFDEDIVNELQEDYINEDSITDSPDGFSNGCENHFWLEESMAEGRIYDGPSQVHLIDYDLSNDSLDSLSSCDCMPKASENRGIVSKNEIHHI
ncbi:putative transcription factor MYC/MYB [Lupinus albus]|uniref:Putative transcription factor MYC/MYB n=1 Tax=Lupinus albus TaxID=3870 RepID=A0A6A4PVT5_LUPAL|nr:putative transcription factor MYC/MYB [Lupinus albus]